MLAASRCKISTKLAQRGSPDPRLEGRSGRTWPGSDDPWRANDQDAITLGLTDLPESFQARNYLTRLGTSQGVVKSVVVYTQYRAGLTELKDKHAVKSENSANPALVSFIRKGQQHPRGRLSPSRKLGNGSPNGKHGTFSQFPAFDSDSQASGKVARPKVTLSK